MVVTLLDEPTARSEFCRAADAPLKVWAKQSSGKRPD